MVSEPEIPEFTQIDVDVLNSAIHEEEKKEPSQPPQIEKKASFLCNKCGKTFSTKFNLNKHDRQVHNGFEKKRMKHIKKDGKYLCVVCGKLLSHPQTLKIHYGTAHSKEDLEKNRVPVKPILNYNRKIALHKSNVQSYFKSYED